MDLRSLAAGLLLALLAAACTRAGPSAPTAPAAPAGPSAPAGSSVTADDADPAGPPVPLLWKVSDADNALYLLGSFHLLQPGDYPLDPRTDEAFEDAERLVFELSPAEMAGSELARLMQASARRDDGRRLQDELPPDTWQRLEAWAARRGHDPAMLQGFEAWYVSLLVSVTEMQRQGLDPSLGLDRHFGRRATEAGKPAEGLETGAQQIALFDGMAPPQQLQALEEALQSPEEVERNVRELHGSWRAGDAAALYEGSGVRMREQYPDLYARVNVERNHAWLPRLQALLDEGGRDEDVLVVVGALHLLGEDGLVALLREAGYTVERL